MESAFINIKEVSRLTGFSISTIYGWVYSRKIPVVKKGGRLRFRREEIAEWMEQGRQPVRPDN